LAKDFAANMPELEFSPAEILSVLLEYRQSPGEAIDNVEAWVTRIREAKNEA
jgi:chaperone BCS1